MDGNGAYCLVISTYAVHRPLMADNSLVQVFFSFASILSSIMQKKIVAEKYTNLFLFNIRPIPPLFSFVGVELV